MTANKDYTELLEELYALDPSLREHEEELKKILPGLIAARPDAPIDPAFRAQLKAELATRSVRTSPFAAWVPVLSYSLVMLLIATGAVWQLGNRPSISSDGVVVTNGPANAFGSLESLTSADTALSGNGGGGLTTATATGMAADGRIAESSDMTIAPFPSIRHKFTGTIPTGLATKGYVYKFDPAYSLLGTSQGKFGAIDLSGLGELKPQNISYIQDGYLVNVSVTDNQISLTEIGSDDSKRFQGTQSASSHTQEDFIRLANAFLDERHVDRSTYGSPQLSENSARAMTGGEFASDYVELVYPLTFDGKPVYGMNGEIEGIRVAMVGSTFKVSSVSNIRIQHFVRSEYDLETDAAALSDVLAHGGGYGGYSYPGSTEKEVSVGSPESAYVMYSSFDNGMTTSFLVPALAYDVPELADGYVQSRVVVPLAKEILMNMKAQGSDSMPADGATSSILSSGPETK